MDEGGQAFPGEMLTEGGSRYPTSGMTLRDYFASSALSGLVAFDVYFESMTPQNRAKIAYVLADAMIAEKGRKKLKENS